jgi:hypothetical protein
MRPDFRIARNAAPCQYDMPFARVVGQPLLRAIALSGA